MFICSISYCTMVRSIFSMGAHYLNYIHNPKWFGHGLHTQCQFPFRSPFCKCLSCGYRHKRKLAKETEKIQVEACPIWTTWIKIYQLCQLLYIWMPTDCNLTGSNCTILQTSSYTFKLVYNIWQKELLVFADEFRHRELCHSVSQTAGSSPCFRPV